MSDPISPVDPKDLELLRTEQPAAPVVKARVHARLAAVIPSMRRGGEGGDATGTGSQGSRVAAGLGSKGSAIVAAFLVGGVMGAALYAGLTKAPAPRLVYVDRPVAASQAAASGSPTPSDAMDAPAVSVPAVGSVPHSTPHVSQLSAERMVLDEARAALVLHDAQRALDELERHRRTFPKALLAEERDAMQVQALVAAGRFDEARTRASAFRKRTHDSLFLPMVDAAIASIP